LQVLNTPFALFPVVTFMYEGVCNSLGHPIWNGKKLQVNSKKYISAGIRTQDLQAAVKNRLYEDKVLQDPNFCKYFWYQTLRGTQIINCLLANLPVPLRWVYIHLWSSIYTYVDNRSKYFIISYTYGSGRPSSYDHTGLPHTCPHWDLSVLCFLFCRVRNTSQLPSSSPRFQHGGYSYPNQALVLQAYKEEWVCPLTVHLNSARWSSWRRGWQE